jgi:hypothetical protein
MHCVVHILRRTRVFRINSVPLMITSAEGERNLWSFSQHVASICFASCLTESIDVLIRLALDYLIQISIILPLEETNHS